VRAELTAAYPDQAARVTRTFSFSSSTGAVTIRDELAEPVGPVRWAAVTQAEVTLAGDTAVLSTDGKKLVLKRLSEGGPWQEFSLTPPNPKEHQNEGFRMIGFVADPKADLSLGVTWQLADSL